MKTYIVAGNRMQYDMFVGRLPITDDPKNYQYVSTPDSVRGISNPHGLFIGTWKLRKDIAQIVLNLIAASHVYNPNLRKILDEVQKFGLKDVLVSMSGYLLNPSDPGVYMHVTPTSVVIGFDKAPPAGLELEVKTIKGGFTRYFTNGVDTHFSIPI
jgi:hypothetical protein